MRPASFACCITSALLSVHPVGVSEHIHAHQSKDDEHKHRAHDLHDTHSRFLSISFRFTSPSLPAIWVDVFPRATQVNASISRSFNFGSLGLSLVRATAAIRALNDGGKNIEIDRLGNVIVRPEPPPS